MESRATIELIVLVYSLVMPNNNVSAQCAYRVEVICESSIYLYGAQRRARRNIQSAEVKEYINPCFEFNNSLPIKFFLFLSLRDVLDIGFVK